MAHPPVSSHLLGTGSILDEVPESVATNQFLDETFDYSNVLVDMFAGACFTSFRAAFTIKSAQRGQLMKHNSSYS